MYKLDVDMKGEKYACILLDWDYVRGEVHLSITGYVAKALSWFMHTCSRKSDDQPYAHVVPTYGAKVQYAPDDNTPQQATKEDKIFVQQVIRISPVLHSWC